MPKYRVNVKTSASVYVEAENIDEAKKIGIENAWGDLQEFEPYWKIDYEGVPVEELNMSDTLDASDWEIAHG